ncbi:MAG: hypothetical protein F4213_05705 [Boseongicola sp. SB0677_bin_26]|nr:hypothetical protein [Boseongicola sp. SB0677_bin_26]
MAKMSRVRRKFGSGFWRLMPAGLETADLDVIDIHGCFQVAINRQCTGIYVLTNVPHPENPDEEAVYLLEFERDVGETSSFRDLIDVLKVRMGATPQRRTTAALAAAANLRLDVAFKRLGTLERQGTATSMIVQDGELQAMAWTLRLRDTTGMASKLHKGETQ